MPLVSSGEISIGGSTPGRSINLEFGRAANATTSMSQLYLGGGIVPNATANNAIPPSGTISLSQFYGATNRVPISIVLSTNQTNYVLNTAKAAGYVAGISDITLTINSGVYVSSNNTSVPALDVDTSWAAGDTITIVNNGFIIGMGGAGGRGRASPTDGTGGSAGGPALRAQRAVSVNNAGIIAGGGGGGGGGGGAFATVSDKTTSVYATGGGGGGGGRSGAAANSAAGAGGAPSGFTSQTYGLAGGAGTVSAAGGGGAGGTGYLVTGGNGGSGGGWGAGGGTGTNGSGDNITSYDRTFGLGGGAAGAAVSGNSNITWIATGTRLGAIT